MTNKQVNCNMIFCTLSLFHQSRIPPHPQVGHMLRTKLSHVNEGGVAAGHSPRYNRKLNFNSIRLEEQSKIQPKTKMKLTLAGRAAWFTIRLPDSSTPGLGALDSVYLVDARSCCPRECGTGICAPK